VLARLAQGVHDISISRAQVSWGIPIPFDTTQTIYVWFEALLNYASALEMHKKTDFWPPTVQLMGKEILWFHAVIWPAMLLAAGRTLPKELFAHGWFTVDGQKMSKTVGNVVDPVTLIEKYGVDATRFFLLKATSFGSDGDISLDRFAVEYEAYLANQLGNLVQRTLTLRQKFGVQVKPGLAPACAEAERLTEELRFDEALAEIWKLVANANSQLDQEKPWSEPDVAKRTATLTSITRQLETIGVALEPYLPDTAEKIAAQLRSGEPEALFPRQP
jgi:methionyl-tRNA synthetase